MPAHIVVIEDDASIRELMHLVLNREGGYHVTSFPPLWSELRAIESLQPDLIIADGRMDGTLSIWTLLEHITSLRALRGIPVLLCTAALTEVGEHEAWLRHKGIAFLAKPFAIDSLLQLAAQCLYGPTPAWLEQRTANLLPADETDDHT